MVTDTRLGRSPRSEAEWAREIERRTTALERAQTARIGPWVLSAHDGRPVLTRPNAEPLEVGAVAEPEVIDLSARGSVVSEMNTADLATAVGMPDVDRDAPPTIDQIREWMMTNLFGQVSPSRIPQLPWAHLFDGKAELLDDPGFDNASTFNSGDPKVNRDAEFGRRKPGSARIDADGATHIVVTNLIPVEQGEKLPLGAWVFYEELVASAAPVRVSVRAYHRNDDDTLTLLSTTQVAALPTLSGDSADHPDQDDDWVWLGGTYTVPGPIGGLSVDEVVGEVKVDATSGSIWVDDATVTKTRDGMPQDWILDLVPDLTNLGNWIEEVVDKALAGLGIPPIGSLFDKMLDFQDGLADLDNMAGAAWTNANNALTDLANKLGISDWNSWLTSQWNVLKNALLTNPASVIGTITQGMVSGLTDLNSLTSQIRDILAGIPTVPTLPIIQDIKDWWTSIGQKVQNLTTGGTLPPTSVSGVGGAPNIGQAIQDTWNRFWDGVFRTTGSTGKTPTDVQMAATQVADTADSAHSSATSAQSSANTISELISIPHIVPSWQGGLADDVSFPIAQIDGTLTSSLNKLYLIPVTTQQDRAYTALKFGLTGTSMTNCYVGIYYMDPTTGNISKVLDCGDVKSSLTSSYNQQAITLPAALLATRGDTYFIGLLQVGGTAGSLHRWSNTTNFSTGLYPQFIGGEASGTFSSLPSLVTAANVIAGTRVWGALGDLTPILAPGSAFYADGFNRANAAQLTTPWTSRWSSGVGDIGVYNNMFGPQSSSPPGVNVYTYNSKMSTTNHDVQADFINIPGTSASVVGAMLLRGNANGCVYVSVAAIGAGWVGAVIRTNSSYNLGSTLAAGTARASANLVSGNFTGTLRCTAIGNTYTLYSGGSQVAQWIDSGGVFAYDGTSREVGAAGYASAGSKGILDNWQAKDI